MNHIVLTCKSVKFYSPTDEDMFFQWLKLIDCIDNFYGKGDELYLHISNSEVPDNDLRDLLAIFYRYKINMKQLKQFLTDHNRYWFYENKKAFWYKQVFGN